MSPTRCVISLRLTSPHCFYQTVKKRKIERRWKAATKIAQAVGKLNLLAKNTLSGKRRATEERRASEEAAAIKNKVAPEAASKNKVTPEGPENI